jgi:hypothetical protein
MGGTSRRGGGLHGVASAASWRSLIRHDDDGYDAFLFTMKIVVVRSPKRIDHVGSTPF